MTDKADLKQAVETLLFITDQPIGVAKIAQALGRKDQAKVAETVSEIQREYEEKGAALQVMEVAEGFQMATRPMFASYVRNLYREKMTMRLSKPALETISIIAYKQPLTRAEIEEIRGVEVIAALETLLEKGLVRVAGRKETVGRPLLYETTTEFLRQFGLRSLQDLPPIDTFKAPDEPAEPQSPAAQTEPPAEPFGEQPPEEAPPPEASTPREDSAPEEPGEEKKKETAWPTEG